MKYFTLISAFVVLASACSKQDQTTQIITLKDNPGKSIIMEIKKGPNYSQKKNLGPISITITPQIAIWVEDTKGNYIDTLYATKAFAKQEWIFVKYNPDQPLRTSCLPYWMNKRLKAGLAIPTKNKPMPDSVSGATPKGSFTLNTKIKEGLPEVVIYAEFNKSFYVSPAFHESEKGYTEATVNGQPSIIYSAKISLKNPRETPMNLTGHGGETGTDGKLYTDLSGFTTASNIISQITIKFE